METIPKVILIIGLPGSGKTTYAKSLTNYLICDDFITHAYNGKWLRSIKDDNQVCLIDPRLCSYSIFDRYMKKILTVVDREDIKLIIFDKSIEECYSNVVNRNDGRKITKEYLIQLNIKYNLNNYREWQSRIIN